MIRRCILVVSAAALGLTAALDLGAQRAQAAVVVTDLGGEQYRVDWSFRAPAGTRTVHLAGTFNEWNPQDLLMRGPNADGLYQATRVLAKGRHEYKFVLDGSRWESDPDNPRRTPGYGNALLFLGIAAPDQPEGQPPPPEPVDMAGEVEHPPALNQLAGTVQRAEPGEVGHLINRWLDDHPMPLVTASAVTFVWFDAAATAVNVQISAYGARTSYKMHRLVPERSLFAVSLDRSKLPERAAYLIGVETPEETEILADPNAWSLTSRSGQPAGLIAPAADDRGRIELLKPITPSGTLRPRDIYVYLPPGYRSGSAERYPVLYMHDGQNCWDDPIEPFGHGGWCVNLAADRLIAAQQVQPFIIVGVANTPERMAEYGPGEDVLSDSGHAYIRFLKEQVKPAVDARYATRPGPADTALMGSSMGGIISLQAALLNPDVFGQAACLSSALMFTDRAGRSHLDLVRKTGRCPVRLYLDSGTSGPAQDGAPLTRELVELLRKSGWQDGVDLEHFEDAGAAHNERAWRARVERPLRFLFGRKAGAAQSQPCGTVQTRPAE